MKRYTLNQNFPTLFDGKHKVRLWGGLLISITFSITLYSFYLLLLELLRTMTITTHNEMWILSDGAYWFYTYFMAFVSLVTGQSLWFNILASKPHRKGNRHLLNKGIVTEQWFLNFSFLFWFTKVGIITILTLLHSYFYLSIGEILGSSIYAIFVLSMIVLFLYPWTSIRRKYKSKSLKWMGISFASLVVGAFILSLFEPVDHQKLTEARLKNNHRIQMDIHLPKLDTSYSFTPDGRAYELFATKDTVTNTITIGFEDTLLDLQDFHLLSHNQSFRRKAFYPRHTFCKLYTQGHMPMGDILKIQRSAFPYNAHQFLFAIEPKNPQTLYERFYQNAVMVVNPFLSDNFDPKFKSKFPLPPPPPFLIDQEDQITVDHQVQILSDNKVLFDGKELALDSLFPLLQKGRKDSLRMVIKLQYSHTTTLEQYLRTRHVFIKHQKALKDRFCQENYQMDSYRFSRLHYQENRDMRRRYRLIILDEVVE